MKNQNQGSKKKSVCFSNVLFIVINQHLMKWMIEKKKTKVKNPKNRQRSTTSVTINQEDAERIIFIHNIIKTNNIHMHK